MHLLFKKIEIWWKLEPYPFLQVEIIGPWWIYIENRLLKVSVSRNTGPLSTKLAQSILGWMGFKFVQMKDHSSFKRVMIILWIYFILTWIINLLKLVYILTTSGVLSPLVAVVSELFLRWALWLMALLLKIACNHKLYCSFLLELKMIYVKSVFFSSNVIFKIPSIKRLFLGVFWKRGTW